MPLGLIAGYHLEESHITLQAKDAPEEEVVDTDTQLFLRYGYRQSASPPSARPPREEDYCPEEAVAGESEPERCSSLDSEMMWAMQQDEQIQAEQDEAAVNEFTKHQQQVTDLDSDHLVLARDTPFSQHLYSRPKVRVRSPPISKSRRSKPSVLLMSSCMSSPSSPRGVRQRVGLRLSDWDRR